MKDYSSRFQGSKDTQVYENDVHCCTVVLSVRNLLLIQNARQMHLMCFSARRDVR